MGFIKVWRYLNIAFSVLVTVGMVAAENISQIISLLSKSGYVEPTAVGAALKASCLDQSVNIHLGISKI